MVMCFSYWPVSTLVGSSNIATSIHMFTISSMSEWRKPPKISTVATYYPSIPSMIHDTISDSLLMVGELTSSLFMYPHCFWTLEHLRPLIQPHRFFFRKMRYLSAEWFSSIVIFVGSLGYIAPFWCNWMIYSSTYSALSSLYNIIPLFTSYLVRRLWCT